MAGLRTWLELGGERLQVQDAVLVSGLGNLGGKVEKHKEFVNTSIVSGAELDS